MMGGVGGADERDRVGAARAAGLAALDGRVRAEALGVDDHGVKKTRAVAMGLVRLGRSAR